MGEWKEPFCPMCGRTAGKTNILQAPGKPWTKIGERNVWEETKAFTGDKPFGVVKSSMGRGTMKFERYYDIDEDDEGYFPFMKSRLLKVIEEWLAKGWITREEVNALLSR